jgi:hypothetical protein
MQGQLRDSTDFDEPQSNRTRRSLAVERWDFWRHGLKRPLGKMKKTAASGEFDRQLDPGDNFGPIFWRERSHRADDG